MKQAERDQLANALQTALQTVADVLRSMPLDPEPVPAPVVDTAALDAANATISQLSEQLATERTNAAAVQAKLDMSRTALRDALAALG